MAQSSTAAVQSLASESPFARLARLIEGIEPGRAPIDLTIGEPRHPMPDFLMERLAEAQALFGKYPPIRGTQEFRQATADWLGRRYPGLAGRIDPERHVLPLAGSREGLFYAVFPACRRKPHAEHPAILIPNPFYHTYAAGPSAAGAEAVFLDARPENGFLPDLEAIAPEILERAAALYLCSPSNPQGAVADTDYLARAIALARRHDFMLFADECYSEIYTRAAPPGVLETAWKESGGFANVVAFQSLSKRSNLPGLRLGFCAGDPDFLESFARFRNVAAPQVALPVQHAGVHLLADEAHVEANRALYREKFAAADEILEGRFGYRRPDGGFFLWLDMSAHGGGERAAQTLWKDCGVKLLPGAYLARPDARGENPGMDFVRVAMVDDLALTRDALTRIAGTGK